MFETINIADVPTQGDYNIAFTMLRPDGWSTTRSDHWLALRQEESRDAGFAVLMPQTSTDAVERALMGREGVSAYVNSLFPAMTPIADDDVGYDDFDAPYETYTFRGRIEKISGRVMLIGATVPVEDVCFALFGFARDEQFHRLKEMFCDLISSFRPVLTSKR